MKRHRKPSLVRNGNRHQDAAKVVGCSTKTVQRLISKTGGLPPRNSPRSSLRLSLSEREEISRELKQGKSMCVIVAHIGRAVSTVSREVNENIS